MPASTTLSPAAPASEISPRLINACAWLCVVVAAGLPALIAWGWIDSPTPPYWARDIGAPPAEHLRFLGGALAMVPALMLARGLYLAHSCLLRFARAEFFTAGAVADLRGFARWSFYAAVASALASTVIGLALTILNPAGHRELAISVGSQELVGLLLSGIFWIMAGVLGRAAQVADENRQFV
jgi:hypothetical protein